jgi:hypothetical protein
MTSERPLRARAYQVNWYRWIDIGIGRTSNQNIHDLPSDWNELIEMMQQRLAQKLHRGLGCRSSFRAVGGEELHHSFHSLQHSFTRPTTVGRCYMLNLSFTFRGDRLTGLFFGYFLLRSKRLNTTNLKFHMLVRLCSSILMKDRFAVLGQYVSKDSTHDFSALNHSYKNLTELEWPNLLNFTVTIDNIIKIWHTFLDLVSLTTTAGENKSLGQIFPLLFMLTEQWCSGCMIFVFIML